MIVIKSVMEYLNTSVKVFDRSREFKNIVVFSKLLFLVLLSILAWINHENEYINKHPVFFVQDCLMLGLSTAIATAFLDMTRIGSVNHRHVLDMFFLFFTYHVLRELSGYFKFTSFKESNFSEIEQKEQFPLYYVVICVFGLLSICGVILAFKVHQHPIRSNSIIFPWSTFILETVIFALILAPPEILISYRHETSHSYLNTIYNSIITTSIFVIFHFVFQLGGFYSVVLKE